jgi:hypothetical protein
MPRPGGPPAQSAARRALTAAVEYGIARAGATADTSRRAARELGDLLTGAGFTHLCTRTLPLSPPVACVIATGSGAEEVGHEHLVDGQPPL